MKTVRHGSKGNYHYGPEMSTEEKKAHRKAYMKVWRRENLDKGRANSARFKRHLRGE